MQTFYPEDQVRRLDELLTTIGRRNSLRDPIGQLAETLDLTPAQLHAIGWLGREGKLSMGELAQRIGVTEKTTTGLVDRLEKKAMVQRERDDRDRRVVHVSLTRTGKRTYTSFRKELDKRMEGLLLLLDDEGRAALFLVLEQLAERVGLLEQEPK